MPLTLIAANLLLAPAEARVQRRYWNEARAKLDRLDPPWSAITGSYGKTSVKHILGHVLETAAPTLITPGSVNTAMGIARVIRERLQPHHRYFVVEMGAYGIGSIRRLCALTPPHLGIITRDRQGALRALQVARCGVAREVRAGRGGARQWRHGDRRRRHAGLCLAPPVHRATSRPRDHCRRGHRLRSRHRGGAPGDGRHRRRDTLARRAIRIARAALWAAPGRNIALAFAAACSLGVPPGDIVASLRSMPQIAHRLEVKRQANGTIVIDDAYNSNPVGFASALELLDALRQPDGRRILVTPGMVELGAEHEAEHARIGSLAAEHADVLVAVAPHRVAPLEAAFCAAAPEREIVSCAGFAEARAWLDHNLTERDVVLLENDLPSLLEQKPLL